MATPAAQINQQLLAQGQFIDQALIQQGLSAGQARQRQTRAPSLFDQVSTGLFSTGVANPQRAGALQQQLAGPFGQGILGKRGARLQSEAAQEQFDANREAFFGQAEAAGVELTPELTEAIDEQLNSQFGFAGAQQVLSQAQQDLPQAVALRQQTVQRAEEAAQVERRTREAQALTAEAAARRAPLENLEQIESISRARRSEGITNRRDFISDVEGNPALAGGSKSLLAANQLDELLQGDFTALDLATSAVLFSQTIEPGLAVREDDRIAFTRGAQSGQRTLRNIVNQFASGEIDAEEARVNVRETMLSLMKPRAQNMIESISFWQSVGRDTQGVKQGDVVGALGLSERQAELLNIFAGDGEAEPAIRQIPFEGG